MVNQSNRCLATINGDTTNNIRSIVPILNILQRIAINDREILYIQTIYTIDIANHLVVCFLHAMGFGILQAVFQRLIDGWSNSTFILGQQRVTATTSQSVSITNNITLDNLDRQLQMTNHRLHNSYLLPVFLTEIRTIGA